jgi:uncharacterized protein YkwD
MKNLSWLGAFVLFLAVAAGTSSVLRLHSTLPTAHPVAAAPQTVVQASNPELVLPSPSPSPSTSPSPTAIPKPPRAVAPAPAPVKVAAPVKAAAPVARHAAPAIVVGSRQQALINQDRARYGLRPLTWSSCLASVAYSNAVRMASANRMWHADGVYSDLACHLGNRTGENIGWWSAGVDDAQINTMFMNSPEHKANILGPFHYVATAWKVASDGTGYIAVEFS